MYTLTGMIMNYTSLLVVLLCYSCLSQFDRRRSDWFRNKFSRNRYPSRLRSNNKQQLTTDTFSVTRKPSPFVTTHFDTTSDNDKVSTTISRSCETFNPASDIIPRLEHGKYLYQCHILSESQMLERVKNDVNTYQTVVRVGTNNFIYRNIILLPYQLTYYLDKFPPAANFSQPLWLINMRNSKVTIPHKTNVYSGYDTQAFTLVQKTEDSQTTAKHSTVQPDIIISSTENQKMGQIFDRFPQEKNRKDVSSQTYDISYITTGTHDISYITTGLGPSQPDLQLDEKSQTVKSKTAVTSFSLNPLMRQSSKRERMPTLLTQDTMSFTTPCLTFYDRQVRFLSSSATTPYSSSLVGFLLAMLARLLTIVKCIQDFNSAPPLSSYSNRQHLNRDKQGMSRYLRFCDESKVARTVRFADHPTCPENKDGSKDDKQEQGTILLFKPNPEAMRVPGFACHWYVNYRRTYWGFSKQFTAQWDRKEIVSEEECRSWWKLHQCNRPLVSRVHSLGKNTKRQLTYMKASPRPGLYSSAAEPQYQYWLFQSSDWYTYNCIGENTTIISSPPYTEIATTTGGVVSHRGQSVLPKGIDFNNLFESGGTFIDDAENTRYVWDKVPESRLCSYIIQEVHINASKVYPTDNDFGSVSESENVENNGTFYFVLTDAKRYMYINPAEQYIQNINLIDHPYCMSRRLQNHDDAELYWTSGSGIAMYFPNHKSEINGISAHLLNDSAHRGVLMDSMLSTGSTLQLKEKDMPTDMTPSLYRYCMTSGNEFGHKCWLFFKSCTKEGWKQKPAMCKQLYENKRGSDSDNSRSKRAAPALRSGYLLGDEIIMERVRFFLSGSVHQWQVSEERAKFMAWCQQNRFDHQMAKSLATIDPSIVLSAYLDEDVYAKPRGDVYDISQCRRLQQNEYEVLPTLRGAGGQDDGVTNGDGHIHNGRNHHLCFTRPIVAFNDSYTRKQVNGQVMTDGRIIFPPAMTETCKIPSLLHFYISGIKYTFKDYELNELAEKDKYHVTEIDFNSKVQPDLVPPIDGSVPVYKPVYTEQESASQMSFNDILISLNRRRVLNNAIMNFMTNLQTSSGGHGGNVGFNGKTVIDAIGSLGWFMNKVVNWFLDFLGSLAGRLITFIVSIIVILGSFYGFFALLLTFFSTALTATKSGYHKARTTVIEYNKARQYKQTHGGEEKNPLLAEQDDAVMF